MKKEDKYYVVFRTKNPVSIRGKDIQLKTYMGFASKEEFDSQRHELEEEANLETIIEGITDREKAKELATTGTGIKIGEEELAFAPVDYSETRGKEKVERNYCVIVQVKGNLKEDFPADKPKFIRFGDRKEYERWLEKNDMFEVLFEGVTPEQADEICDRYEGSTRSNN